MCTQKFIAKNLADYKTLATELTWTTTGLTPPFWDMRISLVWRDVFIYSQLVPGFWSRFMVSSIPSSRKKLSVLPLAVIWLST